MIQIRSWKQIFDAEEGRPTDADAVSPDWTESAEEGTGEFDATTGTVNAGTTGVKVGTNGFDVAIDGNDYGSFTAIGGDTVQTAEMWVNTNGATINDSFRCLDILNSGGTILAYVQLDATAYQIRYVYREDGGGLTALKIESISDGWHHIRFYWKAASGVGNNDGVMVAELDGEVLATASSIDNDTFSVDEVRYGCAGGGGTNSGTLLFDECRRSGSAGSPVWITEAAAKNGSYGIAATIEDTTDRYFDLTDPSNETKFAIRLWVDPSSLTTATNDDFILAAGREDSAGVDAVRLVLKDDGTDRVVYTQTRDDDGNYTDGSEIALSEDYDNLVEVIWWASPSAQQGQGETRLRLNGLVVDAVTGVDNDTLNIDRMRAVARGLDSGTSGLLFLDDAQWSNDFDISITPTIRLTSSPRDFTLSSSQRNLSLTSSPRDFSLTSSKRGSHA